MLAAQVGKRQNAGSLAPAVDLAEFVGHPFKATGWQRDAAALNVGLRNLQHLIHTHPAIQIRAGTPRASADGDPVDLIGVFFPGGDQ